ncbi:MAG: SpoIIE family protein phosphatase [Planctomycetaceae bacterium]|nr:SpoIIE family protein phosphatase [Planctomycetaceae bacterium]
MKPITNHLKLHVGDNLSADLESRLDLPGINKFVSAFEKLTGWTIGCQKDEPQPVERALGRLPMTSAGELEYLCMVPQPATNSSEIPAEGRDLGQSLSRILAELQTTRRALWQREAELATAVPVVSHHEDASELATRLQSILRGAVEGLEMTAAALYLLDDSTSQLKLRSHWGLPSLRFVEPARPLRGAMADLEALTGHAVVMEDARLFAHWDIPESFLSAICVPVTGENAILGTMWIFCDRSRDYSSRETQLVELMAGRIATEIERRVLLDKFDQNRDLQAQCDQVAQWLDERSRLIPPMIDGWAASGASTQSLAASGNFHHWRLLDDDDLMVGLAGVPGEAAGVMTGTLLRGALQGQLGYNHHVDSILQNLNQVAWSSSPSEGSASMFLGRIDTRDGWIESCTAGAIDAYILRPHGWEPIVQDGAPLGVEPEAKFVPQRHRIAPGDVLVVMSDRRLDSNETGIDTTQIAETLLRHIHLSPTEISQMATELMNEQLSDERSRSVVVVKRQE